MLMDVLMPSSTNYVILTSVTTYLFTCYANTFSNIPDVAQSYILEATSGVLPVLASVAVLEEKMRASY